MVGQVLYNWTGPNGYSKSDSLAEVFDPGVYTLTLTGENGCETIKQVEVFESKLQVAIEKYELTTMVEVTYTNRRNWLGDIFSTAVSKNSGSCKTSCSNHNSRFRIFE